MNPRVHQRVTTKCKWSEKETESYRYGRRQYDTRHGLSIPRGHHDILRASDSRVDEVTLRVQDLGPERRRRMEHNVALETQRHLSSENFLESQLAADRLSTYACEVRGERTLLH